MDRKVNSIEMESDAKKCRHTRIGASEKRLGAGVRFV